MFGIKKLKKELEMAQAAYVALSQTTKTLSDKWVLKEKLNGTDVYFGELTRNELVKECVKMKREIETLKSKLSRKKK